MKIGVIAVFFTLVSFLGRGKAICSKSSLFSCDDNTCISIARTCDGKRDCPNGEDESFEKAGCDSTNVTCKPKNASVADMNAYPCKKTCDPTWRKPCRRRHKQCTCDDECGYSCLNPDASCPSIVPFVSYAVSFEVIRFDELTRVHVLPGTPYKHGDMIRYQCREGMQLEGPLPRCSSSRQWTTPIPQCVDVSCMSNPCLNGGTCINETGGYACLCERLFMGRNCEILSNTVRKPHHGTAGLIRQCQRNLCENAGTCSIALDGTEKCDCAPGFSGHLCEEEITCTNPQHPERGYIAEDSNTTWNVGDIATIRCFEGFELTGNETQRCMETGDWSQSEAKCVRSICVLDYYILPEQQLTIEGYTSEELDGHRFHADEVITIGCQDGLTLFMNNIPLVPPELRCEYGGRWTPNYLNITCERSEHAPCVLPDLPAAVILEVFPELIQFQEGTVVIAHCQDGHDLIGNTSITCLTNGTWSELPRCERIVESGCVLNHELWQDGVLLKPHDEQQTYRIGDRLEFKCENEDLHLYSTSLENFANYAICTEEEDWEPDIEELKCVQVCKRPEEPDDEILIINYQGEVFLPDQILYSECPPKHRHAGSNEIRCLEDGSWTEMVPCLPIGCRLNWTLIHESISIDGHTSETLNEVEFPIGQTLNIFCSSENHTFKFETPPIISCTGMDIWTRDYSQFRCHSGSCERRCLSRDEPCSCDFACGSRDDCCDDFSDYCLK